MVYNVLNGDALAYSFPEAQILGQVVVVREALIEGDLAGKSLDDFWKYRAKFHESSEVEYHRQVVKEFEKIIGAPDNSEFNLWFEYDLFCQVNLWFVLSLLNALPITKKVYAVYTSHLDKTSKSFWNGFGPANSDELNFCFVNRLLLTEIDLQVGRDLWNAYKDDDHEELALLSKNHSPSFPYLHEVVNAHIERFSADGTKGRPEKVIEDIIKNISLDFNKVLKEFWKRESIYGFGDTQVRRLYEKVIRTTS